MKKYFLLLLVAFFTLTAKSQTLPIDTVAKEITYEEVVQVDGVSKDELYTRAREWFAKTYKSSQDVIQMDDKSAGKIVGKGASRGQVYVAPLVSNDFTERYTISVTVKDGRYRYEISMFTAQVDRSQYGAPGEVSVYEYATNKRYKNDEGKYKKSVKGYIEKTDFIGTLISSSLKKAMASNSTGIKSKDDF